MDVRVSSEQILARLGVEGRDTRHAAGGDGRSGCLHQLIDVDRHTVHGPEALDPIDGPASALFGDRRRRLAELVPGRRPRLGIDTGTLHQIPIAPVEARVLPEAEERQVVDLPAKDGPPFQEAPRGRSCDSSSPCGRGWNQPSLTKRADEIPTLASV